MQSFVEGWEVRMKNAKLYEMLKDLQNDNELGGFNEFPQFCEDFIFEAINKGYITADGKKDLQEQIRDCFRSDENTVKYCNE